MDADLFTEGAIYYYENQTNTKKDYYNDFLNHDFMVSRPVYILGSNQSGFDELQIRVLAITSSSRRPGIPINITGIKNGKILPYNIRSVGKEYLLKYMGHVNKNIIDEVNRAVKFHLGFSSEKPKYIIEHEEHERKIRELEESLTEKEMSVYNFIHGFCSFNGNMTVRYEELLQAYTECNLENKYSRSQDFSRSLNKIILEYPNVKPKIEHQIKIYNGIGLSTNIPKKEKEKHHNAPKKKSVVFSKNNSEEDYHILPDDKIYELMTDASKQYYDKLDIVQKISNYNRMPQNIDFNIDQNDIKYIKELMIRDITKMKSKLIKLLQNGESPNNLSSTYQYLLFTLSNEEISSYVQGKYLKKGGVKRLRRSMKENIKQYFDR